MEINDSNHQQICNTQKKQEVIQFVKEAFCIDGDVEMVFKEIKFDTYIRCTDSKRGTILIGFSKENLGIA